jgi:hypothetical protein
MNSAMGTPVRSSMGTDPLIKLVSELLDFPHRVEGIPEVAAGGHGEAPATTDNIRIAVELLLGAKKGNADYKANLEIAKGYINKEIATS